ncbi:MAG: RtcB family protein [Polyangiaceae bacterium]|nr:RtcB family protein [Polyangiaceae bacterium]
MSAKIRSWLPNKPSRALEHGLERLASLDDVTRIAVMPDAHLAEEVCVGAVTATRRTIIPAAVGGDIGCGMLACAFDVEAARIDRRAAARILSGLYDRIPPLVFPAGAAAPLTDPLASCALSAVSLERMKDREGRLELGTVGRGNHFIELQAAEDGRLWSLIHSGSRAMGPAIRAHHERSAEPQSERGLLVLDAESDAGRAYLADAEWAAHYATTSRERMMSAIADVLSDCLGALPLPGTRIDVDHNHVRREVHAGESLWVHRKGAMGLSEGDLGVVPGSMGTASYHVEGRGNEEALCSSAHGAGRALARGDARRAISTTRLIEEAEGVFFDRRLASRLREEAPSAYKDVDMVMRAQRELVRILRRLRPVLVFKAV